MKPQYMFESATVKLTAWYLLIIMVISLMFSVMVYHLSVGEIKTRLNRYEQGLVVDPTSLPTIFIKQLHDDQLTQARASILASLLYINLVVLLAGGAGSYLLAKRTLRPIEKMHEAQARFTSDASHELRTPLAAMTTELEVALRDPNLTKAEMKELLASNLEEVNKLSALSHTLLKLSTGDHASLPSSTFSLTETLKEIIKKYDKSGRIELSAETPAHLRAHQPSIEELCTILVDNALKYSPQDSPVNVRVAERLTKVTVTITNTGPGIKPEDLPYIFDRFYRADNSRSSDGHGLGLSLAKQIVDFHRGTIEATSSPDEQTTFVVTLPNPKKQKQYRAF